MLSTSLIRQALGKSEIQNFFTVGLRDTRINLQEAFCCSFNTSWCELVRCKAKDTDIKLEHCHIVEILNFIFLNKYLKFVPIKRFLSVSSLYTFLKMMLFQTHIFLHSLFIYDSDTAIVSHLRRAFLRDGCVLHRHVLEAFL